MFSLLLEREKEKPEFVVPRTDAVIGWWSDVP